MACAEAGGGRCQPPSGCGLDESVCREAGERSLHDRGQLRLAPAQEQLRADVGIDAPGQALDVGRRHPRIAHEHACDQRGQREQVQYVVAEIGGEHRVLDGHAHDVPEPVRLAPDEAQRLPVRDHLGAARAW